VNKIEYLLTCLIEECCEVGQRATKALRFGLDEIAADQTLTNRERLGGEFNDLLAIADMLHDEDVDIWLEEYPNDRQARDRKIARVEKYMDYSRQVGCLN
jgi:NTP pyrophosphatase (non-canonical NTP hydrolase)